MFYGIFLVVWFYYFLTKFFLLFLKKKLQLIYNVVPTSVQKSDPVIYRGGDTHTHIYILLFLYYLPRYSSLRLDIVPVLYNRTSLLIHSKCNSLLLLPSNSQSVPFPLGNHKSVSLGVCYSFVDRFILCHFLRGEGLPMELLGQRSDLSCS